MAELLTDFYTITLSENVDETNRRVHVLLNPQHPVYAGHFPQQPVVPGVCMLQIIKECVEKNCQSSLQYKQIASCKFLAAINPHETPEIKFSFTVKRNEPDTIQIQVEGTSSKEVCIKLKAQLISK